VTATEMPANVALLRDFVNTLDVEERTDQLTTTSGLREWLVDRGLIDLSDPVGGEDLPTALALREGLRSHLAAHHDGTPGAPGPVLDAVAGRLPLRVRFVGPTPELAPAQDGVAGALATLLVAVAASVADGSWERLKICRSETCAWAFYDVSKNRSRTWCAMGVCGNRAKTRAYRARQRPTPARS